jgi:hypothetical protein
MYQNAIFCRTGVSDAHGLMYILIHSGYVINIAKTTCTTNALANKITKTKIKLWHSRITIIMHVKSATRDVIRYMFP